MLERSLEIRPASERNTLAGYVRRFEGIAAALAYGGSSCSIILFNKSVFTTYGFRSPVFITMAHMLVSFLFVTTLKRLGKIHYADFNQKMFFRLIPFTICFVGNILLGQLGTKLISVPMFTTLRRATALVILAVAYFETGAVPSLGVAAAVSLLIIGAGIAGFNDLYFDMFGYTVVLLNNLATAGYLQLSKNYKDDVSKYGLLFYNSMIAFPILAIWCLLSGDMDYAFNFEGFTNPIFLTAFFSGGIMAFAVNLTTVWCTQANSPLTTSVVGQTKNLVTTLVGALLFPDFKSNFLIIFGISVSICGSFLYAYVKRAEKNKQVKKETSSQDDAKPTPGGNKLEA